MRDLTQVIDGCLKNDRQSQNEFYNMYSSILRGSIIKRMKSDECVDELLSLTFQRAFAKLHLYDWRGSITGWLLTILKHNISDYIKAKNRGVDEFLPIEFESFAEEHGLCTASPMSDFYVENTLENIKKVLVMREYLIFVAYYHGYTHREIAHKYTISEGTSKWYVSEAKRKIREKIDSGELVL
jgi:RNA polymerase sigma-70 factor (ECF subfamily)